MAKVVTDDKHYHDIGDAIRAKNGEATQYKPSEMAAAIGAIEGEADYSELESKLSNGFTKYSYMLYDRSNITEAPIEVLKHTETGTDFSYMFYGCTKLTAIPPFDTSSGTNFSHMFNGCDTITTIPKFDVSKSTNCSSMFYNCTNIVEIPQLDTSNAKYLQAMFSYCRKLVTIAGIDFSKVTSINQVFSDCLNLENITINGVIKITGLTFAPCAKLTHDSLMSIINALYDWAAEGSTSTYKLTLGSTNLNKLTDAEKAIATEKGWTLA